MQTIRARRLAAKCLADSRSQRWQHVQGVAHRAEQVGSLGVDDPLVCAAWLHDVGYGPAAAASGLHALDGPRWLAALDVDPLVVSLVAFHTGAEFEAEERGLLDQLEHFVRPPQALLDLLILCDLTVSPHGHDVDVTARIDEIVTRYGERDPVHLAVRRSSAYLRSCFARAASAVSAEERGIAVF
ncbi:hypothetical protein KMZ30_11930 [Phycicoccus sp. KQZ13P-1]|uniref:hypothetical protein n=1 Tax=Phycicoccus mangrovi TaxID=2840470 RepID=UPI001BFFF075|nr:hypothetical protein [Phycicoccus mangrovi]MBT9256282.1 hypothetical protein [Phycicoccus mangrovi]